MSDIHPLSRTEDPTSPTPHVFLPVSGLTLRGSVSLDVRERKFPDLVSISELERVIRYEKTKRLKHQKVSEVFPLVSESEERD